MVKLYFFLLVFPLENDQNQKSSNFFYKGNWLGKMGFFGHLWVFLFAIAIGPLLPITYQAAWLKAHSIYGFPGIRKTVLSVLSGLYQETKNMFVQPKTCFLWVFTEQKPQQNIKTCFSPKNTFGEEPHRKPPLTSSASAKATWNPCHFYGPVSLGRPAEPLTANRVGWRSFLEPGGFPTVVLWFFLFFLVFLGCFMADCLLFVVIFVFSLWFEIFKYLAFVLTRCHKD